MYPGTGIVQRKLPTTTHSSTVSVCRAADAALRSRAGISFEQNVSYRNGLPWPVTIVFRNGFTVRIPPVIGNHRTVTDFMIYVRYRFERDVNLDVQRILDVVDEDSSPELRALKTAVEESRANIIMNGTECVLAYAVSRAEFERYGGSIHIDELDLTLTTTDSETVVTQHPESKLGRLLRASQEQHSAGFTFKLEINDPWKRFGDRFINVANRVYRVVATSDPSRPEGVYVKTTGDVEEIGGAGEKFFDFSVADAETMLFRDAHEARTLGNLAEARKREIEELQHTQRLEILQREKELADYRLETDKKIADMKTDRASAEQKLNEEIQRLREREMRLESEAKERDARLAELKAQRESRMHAEKDYYESRSYYRKDSSEIVKWAPAMVVGLGVLFAKFI